MKLAPARIIDLSGVSLSGLCLAHCLALPVAASLMPALSAWMHADWVHAAFAGIATPVTALALWSARRRGVPMLLIAMAVLGLALLILGATEWLGPRSDVPLTICGGLTLASAHLWNWRRQGRHEPHPVLAAG
jgi:hypothetical protein